MRQVQRKQKLISKHKLPEFSYNDFAGFLRARFYLTHIDKYSQETFEVASFFLDDVIAMMVNHNFTQFTSNERATVKLNEVMQATLVNSDDRDWRYFVLLIPVLYDMQQFLLKEGNVNARFVVQTSNFDINFWRMIVRTVLAINFFKWQGKDVAELMKNSNAIDELQFKFLLENEQDDDFNLSIIEETFRGTKIKIKALTENTDVVQSVELKPEILDQEMLISDTYLHQFKNASVKGVVSDNVINMLSAFHKGIAETYHVTHDSWDAGTLNHFAMAHLLDYWEPSWDSLDGIGGEVKSYLTFLSQKGALKGLGDILKGTANIDRYIDIVALNHLLSQLDLEKISKLA